MSSLVNEGHLWVGWKSSNSGNAIISINAWEVPPPFAPPIDTWHGGSVNGELLWWLRADANDIATAPGGTEQVEYFKNLASGYGGLVTVGRIGDPLPVVQNVVGGLPGIRIDATNSKGFNSATMPLVLDEFTVFAVIVVREDNTTGDLAVFSTEAVGGVLDAGGGGVLHQPQEHAVGLDVEPGGEVTDAHGAGHGYGLPGTTGAAVWASPCGSAASRMRFASSWSACAFLGTPSSSVKTAIGTHCTPASRPCASITARRIRRMALAPTKPRAF
jgi:hypothetical protein